MNLIMGETSHIDADVEEVASSSASSSSQKRKRVQVVPHDIIEIDDDDDTDEVVIIGENFSDKKNKQPMKNEMGSKNKDVIPIINVSSFTKIKAEKDVPSGILKGIRVDPLDFSLEDYDYTEYEDDYEEYEDNDSECEDNDSECEDNEGEYYLDMPSFVKDKNNLNLAAQFDKLDLPPGVEATVPFMENDASRMLIGNPILVIEDEIDVKFKAFKQFDSVRDSTDHYFHRPGLLNLIPTGKKPGKDWAMKIQHEWKVLEKDLPDMIYVRIYEDRMDLLRAVIIGPAGTPYHDGLFFFDIYFPPTYPLVPPMVHYHSGGLRLNPNLYACGKVCLSLLNTWAGHGCEKWNPTNSTILQLLVSIQALVLNAKPYFNEPGYANAANTTAGENISLSYNENTFILSCKTMLYSLRKPPKHFEDFVAGHFRKSGRNILSACRAYAEGAQVGCVVKNRDDKVAGVSTRHSAFKKNLSSIFELLLMEFVVKGADCKMFLAQKAKGVAASASKSAATPVTASTSSKATHVTASTSSKATPVTASASSKATPVTASASSKATLVTASASSKAAPVAWWR